LSIEIACLFAISTREMLHCTKSQKELTGLAWAIRPLRAKSAQNAAHAGIGKTVAAFGSLLELSC
jgi:hypothetical protein